MKKRIDEYKINFTEKNFQNQCPNRDPRDYNRKPRIVLALPLLRWLHVKSTLHSTTLQRKELRIIQKGLFEDNLTLQENAIKRINSNSVNFRSAVFIIYDVLVETRKY